MNRSKSLLLLDNPLEIDYNYTLKLFPEEMPKWEKNSRTLNENISSETRNKHLTRDQKDIIISDLEKLHNNGSKNYLGSNYIF